MKSCVEFESKNVEKAIAKACNELNLSKNELQYDIISNGSIGIFGLVGVKKAKIKVYVANNDNEQLSSNFQTDADEAIVEDFITEDVNSIVNEAFKTNDSGNFSDELVNLGQEALQNIINLITTDAKISVRNGGKKLFYDVKGGNSAILIGKRGQNLEAIQYIVEKIVNKKSDHRVRVQVDVEGYLETRKSNLKALAVRMAEKAKITKKPATIGQMNAHDRRIVHIALKNDRDVKTQSMGDGYYRKLVIFPKKGKNRKRTTNTKK